MSDYGNTLAKAMELVVKCDVGLPLLDTEDPNKPSIQETDLKSVIVHEQIQTEAINISTDESKSDQSLRTR